MRLGLLPVLSAALLLAGCPSETTSLPGPQGPEGPAGEPGPEGPQGPTGPPGTVVYVDGGVAMGPPGHSVEVEPLDAGSADCPFGGVRVTQASDGGVAILCHGAPGLPGAPGATGPAGATGAPGAPGPTGLTGPAGPTGATGAAGSTGAAGVAGPAGATGATGATGPAGVAGVPGPTGPQGPAGPPGQVLYVDGGTVATDWESFAGFTPAAYTGNLGGYAGANQKCDAAFPGSYFCSSDEFYRADSALSPPADGAWVDYSRNANGTRSGNACYLSGLQAGSWMQGASSDYGPFVNAAGYVYNGSNCDQVKPVACCRSAVQVVLRGFTAASFTGNLGGYVGANQKCQVDYPGSFFCTATDYYRSNANASPPPTGAWLDYGRAENGQRSGNACYKSGTQAGPWMEGTGSDYGPFVNASGYVYNGSNCDQLKPLACCENR